MSLEDLNPLKLALKYDPPTLALVYSRSGSKRFLHEFRFEQEDLLSAPEEVYANFQHLHPGYLDKVNPEQVLRLIEQVQGEWVEEDPGQDMQAFLQDVRSRMTEEEYQDFVAKLESGELVLGNEEEYEEDYEEGEDPDNDRN